MLQSVKLGAILACALTVPGCVSAKVFPTGSGQTYPPTKAESVLVFFDASEVGRPYEVIAEIMTEGSSGWGKNDSSLTSKAQKKASEVGAHAIIVTKQKGAGSATAQIFGANDKVQRVQAIRFSESSVGEKQ